MNVRESSGVSRAALVSVSSAAQLALEIVFVKLTRYEFGTLSLLVLGVALLGVACAPQVSRAFGGGERANRRACLALFASASVAGALLFSLSHRFTSMEAMSIRAAVAGLLCFVPLCLAGVPVYVEASRGAANVRAAYFASLAGATLGAVGVFGALHALGDRGGYAFALVLCAASVALSSGRPGPGLVALGLALVSPLPAGALDARAHPDSIEIRSNAFSRIDVLVRPDDVLQFRTAGMNGGTSTAAGTVRAPDAHTLRALSALPFGVHPARALVLGSGAGRNVTQALASGAESVTAVEINGMIPETMARRLAPERDPYRDPRVRILVDEGRETVTRLARDRSQRFDLVYVPIATLFGSSGHAFTQTYLMTEEAFASYARLLRPGGVIAVYSPSLFRAKVTAAVARVIRARGSSSPSPHLAVFESGDRFVLVARMDGPIPDAERRIYRGSFPGATVVDVPADLERAGDLHALTDDNSFLYNDVAQLRGERSLMDWNVEFMRVGLAAALVILLVAVVGVTAGAHRPRAGVLSSALAFAVMGAAYAVLQTGFVQRMGFVVGHPFLATVVVLPASLLGTGLGGRRRMSLVGSVAAMAVLVSTSCALAFVPSDVLLGTSDARSVRCLVGAILTFVTFVAAGSFFPAASARVLASRADVLAGLWLVNGIASVVGAILAVYGAMMLGFGAMMVGASSAYALLFVWDRMHERSERD